MTFHEFDETGLDIQRSASVFLKKVELVFGVRFRTPHHDLALRLLRETVEYKEIDIPDERLEE